MLKFFDKESDEGNIEYKLFISKKKCKHRLLSQCFYRIREGNGKAIYIIGITDNGELFITNIKLLIYSIINFINIIKNKCKFKVKLFYNKPYIYSIISVYNTTLQSINDFDYDYF
jgi:GTPase